MKLPRWWFYLVVVLVAVAGVIFGPQPADMLTLGSADAKARLPLESLGAPDAPANRDTTRAQSFDYFPDHYVNQAKEPAVSIDTF